MPYRLLAVLLCTVAAMFVLAVPANALLCSVAKKPPTAGAAAIIDASGNVTPLKRNPGTEEKPHGGFIAFTDGGTTVSTFVHAPQGELPPTRLGGPQHNCDGKGLDSLEVCFGG
jgi:hypothetical protein